MSCLSFVLLPLYLLSHVDYVHPFGFITCVRYGHRGFPTPASTFILLLTVNDVEERVNLNLKP